MTFRQLQNLLWLLIVAVLVGVLVATGLALHSAGPVA